MNSIESIEDHRAITCDCGSVDFALLVSGGIECNSCCQRPPMKWREYEAMECQECGGFGKVKADQIVDNSGYTLPAWESCDTCSATGYCGPDAEMLANVKRLNQRNKKPQ